MTNQIVNNIESFLKRSLSEIIQHEGEAEPALLKSIAFASSLGLELDKIPSPALFGYPKIKTDYLSISDRNTVIEVKRIGLVSNRSGKVRENECDIKNGIAQTLNRHYVKMQIMQF